MITDELLAELERHYQSIGTAIEAKTLLETAAALRELQERRFTDAICRGEFEYKPPCPPAS